jgi:hypothetical protein
LGGLLIDVNMVLRLDPSPSQRHDDRDGDSGGDQAVFDGGRPYWSERNAIIFCFNFAFVWTLLNCLSTEGLQRAAQCAMNAQTRTSAKRLVFEF